MHRDEEDGNLKIIDKKRSESIQGPLLPVYFYRRSSIESTNTESTNTVLLFTSYSYFALSIISFSFSSSLFSGMGTSGRAAAISRCSAARNALNETMCCTPHLPQ
ncbi:hypothetical protein LARV_03910 [Longilinea arvoryzae]|uniref:Uncharacterized protein n=1 Tax=Longilinea arvoryzae TaxID=360412 RepID=A0A0K8MXX8_9CHLR|nr:hypothetical protein LARV_03910 [Longilinea arvoryzae]